MPNNIMNRTAYYHLPGLFEFYDFYSVFLPIFYQHREFFYDWIDIGSIYGAPQGAIWGGGRVGSGNAKPEAVLNLLGSFGISARLTFSNTLLEEKHLSDKMCNELCSLLADYMPEGRHLEASRNRQILNGVIVGSDILTKYLLDKYPTLYLVSSTTKVITAFEDYVKELDREEFKYVVPDFRLNNKLDKLSGLTDVQKGKTEFLCNEACSFGCRERKACYENVSRLNLGIECQEYRCTSSEASEGYRFSKAMANPGFIGIDNIRDIYLPMGFTNYKIEGRELGSALLLEFILYYMTRPEYQLLLREMIYLDNQLDLF